MAVKSLMRVVLATVAVLFLGTSVPAFAKKADQCSSAKKEADCTKKPNCTWNGKACAKVAAAKPAKKEGKPAAATKAPKKDKPVAAKKPAEKKPAEKKPAEVKPAETAPSEEMPAGEDMPPAGEGEEDF